MEFSPKPYGRIGNAPREFGLVGKTAHMVDEHVSIADIEALAEIYETILEDYFGQFLTPEQVDGPFRGSPRLLR